MSWADIQNIPAGFADGVDNGLTSVTWNDIQNTTTIIHSGTDFIFRGLNVRVQNGSGSTFGAINGLGNLIVGYDEARASGSDKSGSHNLVVGRNHNYSSLGGLVAGYQNTVSNHWVTVSGRTNNVASGQYSSVSGGAGNTSSGMFPSVSGRDRKRGFRVDLSVAVDTQPGVVELIFGSRWPSEHGIGGLLRGQWWSAEYRHRGLIQWPTVEMPTRLWDSIHPSAAASAMLQMVPIVPSAAAMGTRL